MTLNAFAILWNCNRQSQRFPWFRCCSKQQLLLSAFEINLNYHSSFLNLERLPSASDIFVKVKYLFSYSCLHVQREWFENDEFFCNAKIKIPFYLEKLMKKKMVFLIYRLNKRLFHNVAHAIELVVEKHWFHQFTQKLYLRSFPRYLTKYVRAPPRGWG